MRIRTIKPEFWKDERLSTLSRDARLLYIALWCESDDEGRLRGNQSYLHGALFPYDVGDWFDRAFAELVSRLTIESDVRVVIAMRDDFLFHCHAFPGLRPMLTELTLLPWYWKWKDDTVLVGPAPAPLCGVTFQ